MSTHDTLFHDNSCLGAWLWYAHMRQTVAHDALFRVPDKCPYCGGELYAWAEEWRERDNGTIEAGTLMVECDTEPDIDAPYWEEWMHEHSRMPYVYMLPIQERMTRWVNSRFNFDLDLERDPKAPPIGGSKPVPHIP